MPNENRHFALLAVRGRARPASRLWSPAADVYRSGNGWVIKVDVAGLCADDFEIEINGSSLKLVGCRRDTVYREGFVYQQMEITYSRFEKTIRFPCEVEGGSIEHHYNDGFLIINLECE
jgi:HSP20 family protein